MTEEERGAKIDTLFDTMDDAGLVDSVKVPKEGGEPQ